MAVLLLIRHAVTEQTGISNYGRTPGISLSEEGRAQAGRLAERLQPVPLTALYASPLERCVETAAPILAGRRLTLRSAPELIEGDCGRWTGRSIKALAKTKLWLQVQRSPGSFRFPGGESFGEIQLRAIQELDRIAARHRRGIVGVVSHGDLIRLALAHYLGVHIDLFQRIIVSPASVSVLALGAGDGVPRVLGMNETGSLKVLVPRRTGNGGRGRSGPRVRG